MTDYRKNGSAVGGGGGAPSGTGVVTVTSGVFDTPSSTGVIVNAGVSQLVGSDPAGTAIVSDGAGGIQPTSADVSTLLGAADAAAARAAVLAAYDPGARAIDANHVYVWRCADAAGAGSIAEASSGPALVLTGSAWTQGDLALYRGGNAALLRPDAAVADRAVSASTLTAPTGNVTLEVDFMSSALRAITGGSSLTHLVVFSNAAISKYVVIRLSAAAAQVHAACASGGAETTTSASALPLASVLTSQPHHVMAVMTPGTSLALYFDGQLVSSVAIGAGGLTGTDSFASIGLSGNTSAPVGWLGEVRVSNIARDAAYARAAFSTLRSRA